MEEHKKEGPPCPQCGREMKIFIYSGSYDCYYFKCDDCNLTKKEEKAENAEKSPENS